MLLKRNIDLRMNILCKDNGFFHFNLQQDSPSKFALKREPENVEGIDYPQLYHYYDSCRPWRLEG